MLAACSLCSLCADDAAFQTYLRQVWESANPAQAAQGDGSGGGSVQDTLDFKQLVGGVSDAGGRRLSQAAAAPAPLEECVAVSVITLQMLYPDNDSADIQWNLVCSLPGHLLLPSGSKDHALCCQLAN